MSNKTTPLIRHETISKHTADLLEKVKEQILAEPKQFIMDSFFSKQDSPSVVYTIPNCGTAACIAGWAVAISFGTTPAKAQSLVRGGFFLKGVDALQIAIAQADALFYVDEWPAPFYTEWMEAGPKEVGQRAKIAVDRINHFITTGE